MIKAILNSHLPTLLSSDSNDYEILTPSNFLIGHALLDLPESIPPDRNSVNYLKRWEHAQNMKNDFGNHSQPFADTFKMEQETVC